MTFKFIDEGRANDAGQAAGDVRPDGRDEQPGCGTSGAAAVTDGARPRFPWRAYAGLSLFAVALCTVNAFTVLDDIDDPKLAVWKPFVWEWSSAIATIAFLPVVNWLATVAPPRRGRWGRFLAIHLAGSAAYCLFHVGGFVLLRKIAYVSLGRMYEFGSLSQLFYEYRKDLLGYAGIAAVFLLVARLGRSAAPRPEPAQEDVAEPTFDIRDGARLIRAPVKEIVSVRSAGNYVEVHLADGRRPLMRTTLATVEAALAPLGFVRTHRSWLINSQRVRALTPEGSGDWSVELEGAGTAPVSRRFPQALEALRRPA